MCHPELAEDDHKPPSPPGAVQGSKKKKASTRPAVWSYNMNTHWARAHGTSPMPAGLVSAIALKAEERTRLERQHGRAGPKTKASRAAPRTKSTTKSKKRKVG